MKNKRINIDRISFQLGMINCFVEMVACGVKKLATSPPVSPGDYERVGEASEKIVAGFGIKSLLDKSLIITDLQPAEFTQGKWSILYYRDQSTLDAYLALKEKKQKLEQSGRLDIQARKEISREFGRLLSYPVKIIEEKISKESASTPYMLIE